MAQRLDALLAASAARRPGHPAVEDPENGVTVTYRELALAAERVCRLLVARGVRPGDRVGVGGKSIGVVASIFGILEAGAAYVPVDASAPLARSGGILSDCAVAAAIVGRDAADGLAQAFGRKSGKGVTALDELAALGPALALVDGPAPRAAPAGASADLAYVLYTSGSTGKPKGVVHTHPSALAFVDWCSEALRPTADDRFSSHAPFHFDLSIFDLYVSIKHGATLVLIGDNLGKHPGGLASTIAGRRISVWYSTPSILRLLVEFGRLERHDFSALRLVLFAGEVFPLKHMRALKTAWREPRLANLYGPTETNVCTWYELPAEIPAGREEPFPIGRACSGDRTKVVGQDDVEVARGEEGELWVAGDSVMRGYWNLPERTAAAFAVDADGTRWYRTGDLVREDGAGDYAFLGRRDRMVKRRGFRIELGEIEAALYRHPRVSEAAAVALPDGDGGVAIGVFLAIVDGGTIPTLELKQWCAGQLPLYMVPDRFTCRPSLPKTSTDKIDYQALLRPD